MIESIAIRHFQSLHDVSLDLGPLTVVVGSSSSGKSALMRAVHTVVSNRKGDDFITEGERSTSITLRTSEGIVTLTRGKKADDNAYVVIPNDPGHALAPQQRYTKLGGDVPAEVTAFLGITPNDPVVFATQFDKPYLLADSASNVAKVLGELTNVRVIYDAARESNRQKLEAGRKLKTRSEDLQAIKDKVPEYQSLKARDAALTEAEQLIRDAARLSGDIESLQGALDSLEVNEARLAPLKAAAAIEVPDEDELVAAYAALIQYRTMVTTWQAAEKALVEAHEAVRGADREVDVLNDAYSTKLGELADGFEAHMRASGKVQTSSEGLDLIEVSDAAALAASYVETFIRD